MSEKGHGHTRGDPLTSDTLLGSGAPRAELWTHRTHMLKSDSPVPQNVAVSGDRVFRVVTKVKRRH